MHVSTASAGQRKGAGGKVRDTESRSAITEDALMHSLKHTIEKTRETMAYFLIAGAGGYVGSKLAWRLLKQGHRVRGLVRDAETEAVQRLAAAGMVVWKGDVTRPETLIGVADGIDYVYNLTSRSVLSNGALRQTLVEGNQNLIAACSRARRVRAYVCTSSGAPYGNVGDDFVTEDSAVNPCCPLGQVMIEAEQTVMQLVQQHHFPAIILRLGRIYGPERDLLQAVFNQTAMIFGDGANYVSRIHIDDLLMVLEQMPLRGQPGAIYNVADDDPIRLRDLYHEIWQRFGIAPPRPYSREQALRSGLDATVVEMSSASVRMNNARLKHDLGIELRYASYRTWLDEQFGTTEQQDTLIAGEPARTTAIGAF
jgi:nucleoside-diphosphate-sugar epimerase